MGFLGTIFGMACGYEARDLSAWSKMFPNGVSRLDMKTLEVTANVPALDAIRHVQNSYGWGANDSCWRIAFEMEKGNCVSTADGRYFYSDRTSSPQAPPRATTVT
jgi:hypothetical protein